MFELETIKPIRKGITIPPKAGDVIIIPMAVPVYFGNLMFTIAISVGQIIENPSPTETKQINIMLFDKKTMEIPMRKTRKEMIITFF